MKEVTISKKNRYDTKIGAINYLVKNNVYTSEWSGAGMYEAVVKVLQFQSKFSTTKGNFTKKYLDSLLEEAKNR